MDFASVRDALRQGLWIILGTCLVVVCIVAGYTMLLSPEYESSSLVFINSGGTEAQTTTGFVAPGAMSPRRTLTNELGRLKYSQDIRNHVAARLIESAQVLDKDQYFPVLVPEGDRDSITVREVAVRLNDRVSFVVLGEQDMISIVVSSSVPEEAARIANYYAEEYETMALEDSRASVVAARKFLETQIDKISTDLDGIDDQLVAFSRNERVPQQGQDGGVLVSRYAAYQAQRDQAQILLEQERNALEVVTDELAQVDPGATPPPSTSGLEAEVTAYQQRVAELRLQAEVYYANDPTLKGDEGRVPELREISSQIEHYEARRRELENELAALVAANPRQDNSYASELQVQRVQRQSNIRGLEAQVAALDTQIRTLDVQVQGIPRQTVELAQLNRRREMLSEFYVAFLRDLQQTLVAEEAELGYVRIVSTAGVPMAPIRPNMKQNLMLAILLGLGFGVGLAFVRHASKRQITGPVDVESRGFRVLGVIPSLGQLTQKGPKGKRLKGANSKENRRVALGSGSVSPNLLTALDPWSPVTENFRLIRTNIHHAPLGVPKVLLVTSPEMGEGKTLTSTNLAVAMAMGGRRTLLIDADMRRPSTHNMLGGSSDVSLSSILSGESPLEGALDGPELRTGIADLWLLPAGRPTVPPSELLRSMTLTDLIAYARSHFEAIVIDSPPVLVATDVLVLAKLADATVLVVSANKTDARAFDHTLANLEGIGSSVVGIVVNRFDGDGRAKYNYGYTYDYAKDYHV